MWQIITTPHTIHLQQLMPKFHRPGIDHIHHTRINQYKSLEFHRFYFKQHAHYTFTVLQCTAVGECERKDPVKFKPYSEKSY